MTGLLRKLRVTLKAGPIYSLAMPSRYGTSESKLEEKRGFPNV